MPPHSKYLITSRLANYLRINGEKVLNGSSKLSLGTSALCLLNNLFVEVLNEELWHSTRDISSSEAELIENDIHFLLNYIQHIKSLKLFHQVQTLRGGVDISHFTNLTTLELRKIPAHLLVGLNSLANQLKALICTRSLYLLKEIFGTSLNEQNEPVIWTKLQELNLSYNYLETLDQSLKSIPNVATLDLSHNHIKDAEEIQNLPCLTFVNLSYNALNNLPIFHMSSCRSLTKLYIRHNNLEDLVGLDCFFNLEELDVAYNLLSEYHVLSPLDKLKSLKMLNFEGNPLYFHKKHYTLVSAVINECVLKNGLVLNGKRITHTNYQPPEIDDLHQGMLDTQHQTSINTVVGHAENVYIPRNHDYLSRSIGEMSEQSSYEENSASSVTSQTDKAYLITDDKSTEIRNGKTKSNVKKKKKKLREALISERVESNLEVTSKPSNSTETNVPSHIKVKHSFETRRKERGESWLMKDDSFQRIMVPVAQVPANTPASSFKDTITLSEKELVSQVNDSFAKMSEVSQPVNSSSPICKEMRDVLNISTDGYNSFENDDIEVLNSNCKCEVLHVSLSKEDCDIYRKNEDSCPVIEDFEDLLSEEELDCTYFVERNDEFIKQGMFINIGPNYIREQDAFTPQVLDTLDLNSLRSVQRISKNEWHELHLEFDTVKTSRKRRIYIFSDLESAKVVTSILQPFADAKTLREATLGALECVKCNSQFSKQGANKVIVMTRKPQLRKELSSNYDSQREYPEELDACPNCGNHILVEMESFPMPAMSSSPAAINFGKKTSDSPIDNLSVGSSPVNRFSSLFPSIKISPILKRKPFTDFRNTEKIETSISKDEQLLKPELILNTTSEADASETKMRRTSSDITIISNPSQSSIAVISEPAEVNLNPIIETDSLPSLSPPISQDNVYYKAHRTSGSEECLETVESDVQQSIQITPSSNKKTNGFKSFSESSVNTSASRFVTNETVSSGSELYNLPTTMDELQKSTSTYQSSKNELDELSHLLSILGEKRTLSYDTFSEIDHRLKLHLEIKIFGIDEQLEACLYTSIVPLSTGDEFSGLFAISSMKLYIFKFMTSYDNTIKQDKPLDKAVQIVHSSPLNQIKQISCILGSQGLTIACGTSAHVYTLIIRDADVCNSFSSLLSDFLQERQLVPKTFEFMSPTEETFQMIQDSVFCSAAESDKKPEILLHLFAFWWNNQAGEVDFGIPACVIVTVDEIFIARILYKKKDPPPNLNNFCVFHYTLLDQQKMSDLICLKLQKDLRSVEVNFLNELSQENSDSVVWNLRMETKSALFSFISALKSPWEDIFAVPLSLVWAE